MISVRRRLLNPPFNLVELNADCLGVRFGHQGEQIALRVCRIKCNSLEHFAKFLLRKIAVFVFAPFWFAAEKDARERFFGQIIELSATISIAVFFQNSREVCCFLRQHQQLRMIIE